MNMIKTNRIILTLLLILTFSFSSFGKENTTIIMLNPNRDYQKGEIVNVKIGVSSPDGSYLKSAVCGFGYNGSTMKLITETQKPDSFLMESDVPAKWLYYDLQFEMLNDGKMYFIAGASSKEGTIRAIKADGSRIDLPRASVVYKIGTGLYTKVSDCNLEHLILYDENKNEIKMSRFFDKNISEYWVIVGPEVSNISFGANVENKADKIILPKSEIDAGESVKEIAVEATDGTQKKYIFHISKPIQPVVVDNIIITNGKGEKIPYDFSKDTEEYYLEVENDVHELKFMGETQSKYMSFQYPDAKKMEVGYNNLKVVAITQNQEKTYAFNIFRKPSKLQIMSLIGELSDDTTLKMDREFTPEKTEYSANVTADVKKVKFLYKLGDSEDKIIENSEFSLNAGINDCKLTVSDGVNEKVYSIVIIKDDYKKVSLSEDTNGPSKNENPFTSFIHKDLRAFFVVGFISILFIGSIIVIQLTGRMKEYKSSEEARVEREEKERLKRLKEKEKQRKRSEK